MKGSSSALPPRRARMIAGLQAQRQRMKRSPRLGADETLAGRLERAVPGELSEAAEDTQIEMTSLCRADRSAGRAAQYRDVDRDKSSRGTASRGELGSAARGSLTRYYDNNRRQFRPVDGRRVGFKDGRRRIDATERRAFQIKERSRRT